MAWNPIKFCTYPFVQHLVLLELRFSLQKSNRYILPEFFATIWHRIWHLTSGCDRWQVHRSHMTNPSIHSLAFHVPGHHAGSKSTQICPEECCIHSLLKWTKGHVHRREVFIGAVTWHEIWLWAHLKGNDLAVYILWCMSYTLSCNLPWNEVSIPLGWQDVCSAGYTA